MISAQIIADSENQYGNRITTMLVTFPRIILAEFNTHRMFSRNSASSRAIPFKKMVEVIKTNPFVPLAWMKDHPGMQGSKYFTSETCAEAWPELNWTHKPDYKDTLAVDYLKNQWLLAKDNQVESAEYLSDLKVTKQFCNRKLETYMWHTVIVTATEWENFFALRCPDYQIVPDGDTATYHYRSKKDYLNNHEERTGEKPKDFTVEEWLFNNKGQAEIHMMALAEAMYDAYNESTPKELKAGEWHIPFADKMNEKELGIIAWTDEAKIKVSTVFCARVSYTVVGEDQKPLTYQRAIEIHDAMLAADPKHMSPFEHCAKTMNNFEYKSHRWQQGLTNDASKLNAENGWSGNFRGFIQYRKLIPGENVTE